MKRPEPTDMDAGNRVFNVIVPCIQNEPQNVEQGISNFEVFYFTSAVQNFLFNIRYFLLR
jgi:hypothetical protein